MSIIEMAFHSANPVREQLKAEILSALSATQDSLTTSDLYHVCRSATSPDDVAKVAYDLKKKGLIADGGKVPHPRGSPVNSYRYPIPDDPRIEAAKPIKVEPTIKKNRQPAIKRKPPKGHPFAASIMPQEAHDGAPRVTRPLPSHLQSTAPQMAAESIHHHILETAMSEDPLQYIPDPDAFTLEPREPEADEDIDSELIDLLAMAHLEPKDQAVDDVLAMASADVGEIAAAMANRHEVATKKACQCLRINSLPPLPNGYRYSSLSAEIVSEDGCEILSLMIITEGGGPFVELDIIGKMRFNRGEMAMISQAADALIEMMEMDDDHA